MMHNKLYPTAVLVAILGVAGYLQFQPRSLQGAPTAVIPARQTIEVYFSPNGGCTEAIVNELNNAKTSIEVQAYSFTSPPIAEAVAKAHARGVKVRVILDKSQKTERYSSLTYLRNHNVPTWVDAKHAIAHNKVMIIDRQVLLTGSFNFSKAAEERNAENLLVIRNHPELIGKYLENFEAHLKHSSDE